MKYCYVTMKTTAIENPNRMKISIDEFISRLDMWSILVDNPDELEEVVIGLMDGLTDKQIGVYVGKFITKREMITLRVMLTNGASMQEVTKTRVLFEMHNHNAVKIAEKNMGPISYYHLDSHFKREELRGVRRNLK